MHSSRRVYYLLKQFVTLVDILKWPCDAFVLKNSSNTFVHCADFLEAIIAISPCIVMDSFSNLVDKSTLLKAKHNQKVIPNLQPGHIISG